MPYNALSYVLRTATFISGAQRILAFAIFQPNKFRIREYFQLNCGGAKSPPNCLARDLASSARIFISG